MSESSQEIAQAENDLLCELNQPCWSVVTYQSVAVSHLTYPEAEKWAADLRNQGISGLCIVTDDAAARIAS